MKALIKIPNRVSATILAKLGSPNEPTVILVMVGLGSGLAAEISDRDGKTYIFQWDRSLSAHALRVPLSLWMQNKAKMAHDLMNARTRTAIVPLFMVPEPVEVPQPPEGLLSGVDEGSSTTQPPEDPPVLLDPVMKDGKLLHLLLAEHVAQGAQRIKAVAHTLQVEEEAVKTAALESDSTVEVATGGWVRLKAAPVATTQPPAQE